VAKEELPERCPPAEAVGISGVFVRLVAGQEIAPDFCASGRALGTDRKKVDPCIWSACSLVLYDESWRGGPIARVRDFAQAVRLLRHKPYGAILELTPEDGVAVRTSADSPHWSFWMAHHFDPMKAVKEIVRIA
jgi:hypothetical protein